MEHEYGIKRLYWIFGVCLAVFAIAITFYIANFFKKIDKNVISSVVSYISENAHTGLDRSPGAELAFTEPEEPKQYAVVIPKKVKEIEPSVAMGERPSQLFDINLEVDSTSVYDVDELGVRVNFTSFGNIPTPVSMTFKVLDNTGKTIYTKTESIIVETEQVYSKSFAGLVLSPGNYTIRLVTLYNVNVTDEFESSFKIKSTFSWPLVRIYIAGILAIIVALALFFPRAWYKIIFKSFYHTNL